MWAAWATDWRDRLFGWDQDVLIYASLPAFGHLVIVSGAKITSIVSRNAGTGQS
jgi:hypothetical protein